jgi:hypothetical protein
MTRKLANFALFQAGWFACVLGAGAGHAWFGPLAVLVILALHLTLVERSRFELMFVVVAGLIGTVLDSFQTWIGAVRFAGSPALNFLCPLWITALWCTFGTTLNVSLGWLHRRFVLAALLGAVAGPLTYVGASRLDAVVLPSHGLAIVTVGIEYALAMPMLLLVSGQIRRMRENPSRTDRQSDELCEPEA